MKVKKLNQLAQIPKYQTAGASGFDFHSVEDTVVMPGESTMVGTGLAFEIPTGLELQVRPRSGMSAKTKIRVSNSPGTIDADYRGEVKILLDNIGTLPYTIRVGDRIAQGVFMEVHQYVLEEETEDLSSTSRGSGGIGSTGV